MNLAVDHMPACDEQAVGAEAFREGMARVAGAVHIITSADGAAVAGTTATAVCSVSDSPPTLLVCLHRQGRLHGMLRPGSALAVNTLRAGQEELAGIFAGKGAIPMEERFRNGNWHFEQGGAPCLLDGVASFQCRVESLTSSGSHSIVICKVLGVRTGDVPHALIYGMRRYAHVRLSQP